MTPKQRHAYHALVTLLADGTFQVGDQLPSFAALAERFGVSVKVMQSVLPRLAAEGILTIQPQIGTWLRQLPNLKVMAANAPGTVTLWINEIDELFSPSWRRLRTAFEAAHPQWRIEATLSGDQADLPLLRRPMVQVLEFTTAQHRLQTGGPWMAWAKNLQGMQVPPVEQARALGADPRVAPIVVGSQALWLHRSQSGTAPWNGWESIPKPLPSRLGWVLSSFMDPLYALGACGGGKLDRPGLERYLQRLLDTPPPSLVLPCDLDGTAIAPVVAILRDGAADVVSGWTWMHQVADLNQWRMAPMPGNGPVSMGAMAVLVREDLEDPEPAMALARFIAGAEGQRCLAASEAYVPALASAGVGHALEAHTADACARGWPRQQFTLDLSWLAERERVEGALRDLRTRRIGFDECLQIVLAFSAR
jgi:hypothetical protein